MTTSTVRATIAGLTCAVCIAGTMPEAVAAPTSVPPSLPGITDSNPLVHSVAYRPSRVRRNLRRDGWRQIIFVDDKLPTYVVRACRNGQRFELRLNRFGEIRRRRELGECRSGENDNPGYRMSPTNVRRVLRGLGYRSIDFKDRELPIYVAEACLRQRLYRLRINRRGDINYRERIGRCRSGNRIEEQISLKPNQVRTILEGSGFNRVRFTDRALPEYVAEACKNNRRFELRINRRGDIRSRRRVGACREVDGDNYLTLAQVSDILRARRYYRIRYTDRKLPWYRATACRNRKEFNLLLNRWGDIRRRRQSGVCEAPDSGEIVAVVPRRRINIEELRTRERIDADECQDYLEGLLEDNTINFSVGSAKIERGSYDLLERLAFVTTRCPETNVEIAGHTDSDGSRADNQRLSERRALSVANFLIERDVDRSRLRAAGYGEDRPIATNRTSRGKAQNRRIEFVVSWGE